MGRTPEEIQADRDAIEARDETGEGFAEALGQAEQDEQQTPLPDEEVEASFEEEHPRQPQPGDDVTVLGLVSGGSIVVLAERDAVRDQLIHAKRTNRQQLTDDDFIEFHTIEGEQPYISASSIILLGHGKVVAQERQAMPGREPVIASPGDLRSLPPMG